MSSGVFSPVQRDDGTIIFRLSGRGVREQGAKEDEDARKDKIARNRAYYHGTQYDRDNALQKRAMVTSGDLLEMQLLPEHVRLNVYSVQIAECVDFIANQLTDGFTIVATDPRVQTVIDSAVDATELLRNGSDEDMAFDELVIDGAQAGDVPYEVLWDPVEAVAYWEFWPAESVEFDVPYGSWVKKVTRKQMVVVEDVDKAGTLVEREVEERCVFDLQLRLPDDGSEPRQECRKRTYWDDDSEDEPRSIEWLGLPFIPWGVIRVDKKGLRGYRGDPLITKKACDNADRYNANEQQAWLIARYNAHGNLAVVGDAAYLKLQADDNKVAKDLPDVLGFPGGTGVFPVSLPTDPQMIEHTRRVTSDAMYNTFGLVRVEPDTLSGLGTPSGYALEVLNRKSDGTLRRIRRLIKTDTIAMISLTLDVTAYRQGVAITDPALLAAVADDPALADDIGMFVPERADWTDVDPQAVFPNRKIQVRMGSGYIVDEVMIRDDFIAGLISLEEALRQRGEDVDEIARIIGEIDARAQKKIDQQLEIAGRTAQTVAEAKGQNSQTTADRQLSTLARNSGSAGAQKAGNTTANAKAG
jgi:hypothetical protein